MKVFAFFRVIIGIRFWKKRWEHQKARIRDVIRVEHAWEILYILLNLFDFVSTSQVFLFTKQVLGTLSAYLDYIPPCITLD